MTNDYPLSTAEVEILRMTVEAHPEFWNFIAPKGYTICAYCRCHLVWDLKERRLRHKIPRKGQACLILRKITQGARA